MTNHAGHSVRRFDDIHVGDEVRLNHRFTAEEVAAFARLSGDTNPLHIDEEFARGTTFGRPVVHGMLSAAHISAMIGTKLPGSGALWFQQQFEFPAPVFIGDDVEFLLRVEHKSTAARSVVIRAEGRNQNGVVVLKGQGTVMMVESEGTANSWR